MKNSIVAIAALLALAAPVSAAAFTNDSGAVRAIGSTVVGLVETDGGHKEVTHIVTDAGINSDGSTWFAYASPIVTLADMRGN